MLAKVRASIACTACRSRKVRCDITQRYHVSADGKLACSNCKMNGVSCVIQKRKRPRKRIYTTPVPDSLSNQGSTQNGENCLVGSSNTLDSETRSMSGPATGSGMILGSMLFDIAQPTYQNISSKISRREHLGRQSLYQSWFKNLEHPLYTSALSLNDTKSARLDPRSSPLTLLLKHKLPENFVPLPLRMTSVEIDYLFATSALSIPVAPVRNALLRIYVEYVYPYMPSIELRQFLESVNDTTGKSGKVSLLLFQGIMFAGAAFVDMEYLEMAGYSDRRAARRAFFHKARALYDLDYETVSVSLIQSVLLMTYWYETPNDPKDSWHWIDIAISLAYRIGLHRNLATETLNMKPNKKRLWRRIWWSCFMRDRLIALGMKRPMGITDDYGVPMLEEKDFEIEALQESNTIIGKDCTLLRDPEAQRAMAQMCTVKAKLCLCIGYVLSVQSTVHTRSQRMGEQTGTTPWPKELNQTDKVQLCDAELTSWKRELPQSCLYSTRLDSSGNGAPLFVQRSLLHLLYCTSLFALHRPEFLSPSIGTLARPSTLPHKPQAISRKKAHDASLEISQIGHVLHIHNLDIYLPTTAVTIFVSAISMHLLDIKSCENEARQQALDGLYRCRLILRNLRDIYPSADFSVRFLDAALGTAKFDTEVPDARVKTLFDETVLQSFSGNSRELRKESVSGAIRRTSLSTSSEDGILMPSQDSDIMGSPIVDCPALENNRHSFKLKHSDSEDVLSPSVFNNEDFGCMNQYSLYRSEKPTNMDIDHFLNFDGDNEVCGTPPGGCAYTTEFGNEMNWFGQAMGSWDSLGLSCKVVE